MPIAEQKRRCCQLLAKFAQNPNALQDIKTASQLFATLAQECPLLRQSDKAKLDLTEPHCYLYIGPDADQLVSEAGMTIASDRQAAQAYYHLLAAINNVLSKNAQTQQISQYQLPLLADLRNQERKFGAVLAESSLLNNQVAPEETYHNSLQSHPLLSKTQAFDGISDRKSTPVAAENPEAQQKAEQLTLQPRPGVDLKMGKSFNPRPNIS